jgi:hypothetical protein
MWKLSMKMLPGGHAMKANYNTKLKGRFKKVLLKLKEASS